MNSTVVFPGSFDPFTLGHSEVVEQALAIFSKVVIAIGESPGKTGLFTHQERQQMIAQLWQKQPEVQVCTFAGLVVDFAKQIDATVLIRGLRTEADFSYEMPMAMTNREIGGIQTVFIPTDPRFAYVSSSLVREVARHGGDITRFVAPTILKEINQRLHRHD